MTSANPQLRESRKSRNRMSHWNDREPRVVQIVGSNPDWMADCARYHVAHGAQIIDINMGCPVKKVCENWCGSALLQDEKLVQHILEAVVRAVTVPVTLKFRTGWDHAHKNAPLIARLAEETGIAMLTLHGRTREDGYLGKAEYDTIAAVKAQVHIPVVANGDIDSPEKARDVLAYTKADAVMIGRAAQGRPWLFREIVHYLQTGTQLPAPTVEEACYWIGEHLQNHHAFYGAETGVRTARKHIAWYVSDLPGGEAFRKEINQISEPEIQLNQVNTFLKSQIAHGERLQYHMRAAPSQDAALTC